jgi:hypothetical protein
MKIEATLKACKVAVLASAFASVAFSSTNARAEDTPQFVDRKMSLPPLVIAIDGALALGHWDASVTVPNATGGTTTVSSGGTGLGFNAEGAIGIIPHLTAGARVIGLNFSDDSKISNAAAYGQQYDLQQVPPSGALFSGQDTFSNPELWGRYQFVDLDQIEVGVEARLFLPFASNTKFGLMGGVPVSFHLPNVLRVDTGGYIGFGFYDSTFVYFHIPAQVWFQVNPQIFLGPLTGLTVASFPGVNAGAGGSNTVTSIPLGFGIGYTVMPALDIKVLPIYWPGINNDNGLGNFGMSAGVEFRLDALANRQ